MWMQPQRPTHAVTQPYNDGMITICRAEDSAKPGHMPQPKLFQKVRLPYAELRMGIRRYYEARANQAEVERVLRVPDPGMVSTLEDGTEYRGGVNSQDVAIDHDGRRYSIELVQLAQGVYPRSIDLTLRRVDPRYETAEIRKE